LSWSATRPADFAAFRLYRGATTSFVPATANLLVETTATSWVDPAGNGFYKLSAIDRNGNESEFVTASAGVAGTGVGEPVAFGLHGTLQNPVRGDRLDVAFSLAREGVARLEMFDVSGRRVADRDLGRLEAGAHTARISGATRIATGIYHLRLSQNGETRSVRVAVID